MSEKHPSSSSSSAPPMPVVYCAVDNITMCCVGLFGPAAIRLFLPGSIGSPVICPPQSYKSNTRTTTKCCAQHEIVKAPGDTGQFQGWVWCFTASLWWLWRFYSILFIISVCLSRLSLATTEVTSRFGHVWTPQPSDWTLVCLGRCATPTFVCTISSRPHSQGINKKGRAYPLRAVERLEHIPWWREDRQVRFESIIIIFLQGEVPANYLGESTVWDELNRPEKEQALAFPWEHCVHLWKALKFKKQNRFSLFCLAYFAIYCFCKNVNVNSLQKDLYVYQQMYLLDILNI